MIVRLEKGGLKDDDGRRGVTRKVWMWHGERVWPTHLNRHWKRDECVLKTPIKTHKHRALIGAFGLDFGGLRGLGGPTDWSAEGSCVRRMFVTAFRYHRKRERGSQSFTVRVERASSLHLHVQ